MVESSSHDGSQIRQDSSVEPRAYRPARWPPSTLTIASSPTTTPTPTNNLVTVRTDPDASSSSRCFPRSLTVPISRHPRSFSSTPPASDLSEQSHYNPPVLLAPGLSPLLRNILPHPKAVRPNPFPTQSDLSAASTRAEQEPTALRDLRRVTAPPALLDPAHYELEPVHSRRRERDRRKLRDVLHEFERFPAYKIDRFRDLDVDRDFFECNRELNVDKDRERERAGRLRNSTSASSLTTDRMSDGARRERWTSLVDHRRSKSTPRSSKFTFRNWLFSRDKPIPFSIPDRLHDVDHPSHPDRTDTPLQTNVFRNDRHPPDDPLPHVRSSSLDETAYGRRYSPILSQNEKRVLTRSSNNKVPGDDIHAEGFQEPNIGATFDETTRVDARYNKELVADMYHEEERMRHHHRRQRQAVVRTNGSIQGRAARRGHSLTHLRSYDQEANDDIFSDRLSHRGGELDLQKGPIEQGNSDSVISALTNESDEAEGTVRTRSASEAGVHRRLSLVNTKDKVLSVWERFFNRRRSSSARRQEPTTPERNIRPPWLRFLSGEYIHG